MKKIYLKNANKQKKNYAKYVDKKEELCNIPTFALTSPKFKIISVVKKTKWLTAKEGDVIYGSLPVIETDNQGNKTVRDYYRRILGFYNKKLNVTQDFNRRVVATGDVCANFLTFK